MKFLLLSFLLISFARADYAEDTNADNTGAYTMKYYNKEEAKQMFTAWMNMAFDQEVSMDEYSYFDDTYGDVNVVTTTLESNYRKCVQRVYSDKRITYTCAERIQLNPLY